MLLFCLILLCDLVSKGLAFHYFLPLSGEVFPYGGIAVFSVSSIEVTLNLLMNPGAAWGLFGDYPTLLLAVRLVAIAGLFLYTRFFAAPALTVPLLMILAGAVGNVIDYFVYGSVVDFVAIHFWGYLYPLFNLADSSVCVGAVLYLWKSR